MFPILFEIGPLKINSYGLMIAVGFLTALFFAQRDAVKRGLPPKVFADMAFILLPLGIAGTRLAHIIMFPEYYSWDDPIGWTAIWRGGPVFRPWSKYAPRSRPGQRWRASVGTPGRSGLPPRTVLKGS